MSIESKIRQNVPLAEFSTFKIGGPAKFFIEIKDQADLLEAYEWGEKNKLDIFILGGGSNLLINSAGVNGLVIKFANEDINVKGERLDCGAGASLAKVISIAAGNSLSGLEWAAGIPRATVGGAIRGNAEAFESPVSEIVETVEVYDIKNKNFRIFSRNDCQFAYRQSIFKREGNLLIWQAVLKLRKADKKEIDFLIEKSLNFRQEKYPNLPSAGSVFENFDPEYIKANNLEFYNYVKNLGKMRRGKVGVGLIIDLAGLKGKTVGGAKVSLEHANHVINTGKATSEDVITLISLIKQQVRNRFKLQLKEEVQYLGY